MRRIDGVAGNRDDDPDLDARLAAHERAGTLERVVIDAAERTKSRLRVETDAGTDLGIVVEHPPLREGDVLFVDEDAAAVVGFEREEAYVVDLPEPSEDALARAVELGHRIGNQHWDVAVRDGSVYVAVEADRPILESVLAASIPDGAATRYEDVDAALFLSDDGRERHGGRPHGHAGDHAHGHTHHGHESDHSHDHGTRPDDCHDE